MGTSEMFIHPSLAFIAAAIILPFLPREGGGRAAAKALLLIPPVIAIIAAFTNSHGDYAAISWLGQTLHLGRVDAMSSIFIQVFAVMSLAGLIFSLHVEDRYQHVSALFYVAGGMGCVLAGDYLSLFLFWEIMAIGSTFLVMLNRTRESVLAGFRYFLYHVLGGLFLLAGLVMRYKATGTFDFVVLEGVSQATANSYDWLILLGFCVNAAVVPLHAWLPDAYPRGTVTGSVFMCAYTTKTAVYVLMRGFAGWEVLAVAGTVMAVYGVLYASMENNARRILSYHIVSQVGYMVAGIGVGTAMTLNGAAAHAYAHILYKGLLFMTTGAVLYSVGTAKLDELGGLAGRLPLVMLLYMVAALSISGMPVFNGFISKTMTIAGAAQHHRTLIALGLEIAAVGTFISVGLKLPYFAFWGGKPLDSKRELKPIPANMYAGMAILAVLCVAQGLFPDMLYRYLPFAMNAANHNEYNPWTAWNVLQSSMLLGFAGLAFYVMRRVITPHTALNLDFDWFYRLIGRGVLALVCRPAAAVDNVWTNVYNVIGVRFLKLCAAFTKIFDKYVIDLIVDGGALGVREIGGLGSLTQNGRLQHYLGLMVVFVAVILALIWYVAPFFGN
ncbi:Na(+)/H(+) antiporter subunit D [Deltaproteobacteria bacterium OttesenSCG-928-K17]|nr:Na(+)/H(+) antiporter subunit D [Deltaproteobacteria bacterium OttesenSCG-928-K17]